MAVKLLIAGQANTGKTTLLQSLEDVFVVAHDGKQYPFPQPHINISRFNSVSELLATVNTKLGVYKEKFGKLPTTIAFDSVSTIFETIANNCGSQYKGFDSWKHVNMEVAEFNSYIEDTLIPNGINVVIVSHAVWNVDTATYELVAQGSFAKKGGFLSTVDNSVFIEVKSNKRIIHHRSTKFAARSALADLPDNQPVEEYNLQQHINKLSELKNSAAKFEL
jgi:GTPase SAR1 family protein